tara:strand:+ start:85 stop:762 length:678 start_codon:yes stop_codon:yes gene_type:complete
MRLELKYNISISLAEKLFNDVHGFFSIEENSNSSKPYENVNIYYDDLNFKYYNEKKEGMSIRNKVRMRFSRPLGSKIFTRKQIEIKKRRGFDATKDIFRIDNFDYGILRDLNTYLHKEHNKFVYNKLIPTAGVRYNRVSLYSKIIPGVRITFDTSVKCFTDFYNIDDQKLFFYILQPSNCLVELKIYKSFPLFLKKIIMEYKLQQVTYSKYANSLEKIYNTNYKK